MCVGWPFKIAYIRLWMLLLSAGMCVGWSFEIVFAQLRMLLLSLGCASDGRSNHLILHFAQTTKEFVTEEYGFYSIGSMRLVEWLYLACCQLLPRSDMEATLFALVFHVAVALVAQLFQYCSQCLCQLLLACRLPEKRLAVKAHIGNVKSSAILMG